MTKRQQAILEYLDQAQKATLKEITKFLSSSFENISKPTLLRDIDFLLQKKLIQKKGKTRSITYESKAQNPLLRYIDIEKYFQAETDQRQIKEHFNWQIFKYLDNLFTQKEINHLNNLNLKYQQKIKHLPKIALQKELERITIELSWKSSQLEGNTYSLIDTEILIKENKKAPGHSQKEAAMILNHKNALNYILKYQNQFKELTIPKIRAIHSLMVKNLDIMTDFRTIIIGIIGTKFKPIDNQFQIKEALEKTCKKINQNQFIPAKALLIIALISYIQPFLDGNKRTSRILANAILLANNWCPLSLRNINEAEYKKAIILIYEQNNLRYIKELFIKQFEFVVENYFG